MILKEKSICKNSSKFTKKTIDDKERLFISIDDFKKSMAQISHTIFFDESDFLREKSSDPALLSRTIEQGEKLRKRIGLEQNYFLLGSLGNLYRIDLQPRVAIPLFKQCLEIADKEQNKQREVVTRIRLGETLKYDGRHEDAWKEFERALKLCETNGITKYRDFVYQHMGKCLMELSEFAAAEECFEKALEIRKEKGEVSLIESTQKAIEFLNRKQKMLK